MARDLTATTTNYLNVGDVAAIDITGTALTLSCWVQLDTNNVARDILGKRGNAATTIQYGLDHDATGHPRVLIGDAVSNDQVTHGTAISTGAWAHVAAVKNGTGATALKIFLNGVAASTTSNRSIQNTAQNLRLGISESTANSIDGRLADVGIWDASLSDAEIAALTTGVSPLAFRRDHLKGYWPLFGVAYPEVDLSGSGNNATQTGTVNAANHAPVGSLASVMG